MSLVFIFVFFVAFVPFVVAQNEATDAQLEASSAGRVVRVGPAAGAGGPVAAIPLELYVARVLAGEGEPNAADAARQALAVAIRTFALANAGRHAREGFDLCDGTHCQVPRAATAVTRRAALATAGRILTYEGSPAELFYSASCGGYSERAADVWPGVDYPYLPAAPDDVHEADPPWTLVLTREQVEQALGRAGFDGRLRDVRVEARTASGRAARVRVSGLVPGVMTGDAFRAAIGTTTLRSTAFSVEIEGRSVRFTGRGYGHGVGMCVIGAGRRAARGERMEAILGQYYPGLVLSALDRVEARGGPAAPARGGLVRVPSASGVAAGEVEQLTLRAHADLSVVLGVSIAPITVRIHESIEGFRAATGRPWWVSEVAEGTSIDLAPMALLAQRDGLDLTLRTAVADLLLSQPLRGRPAWIRVGAARFFGLGPARAGTAAAAPRCPSDAELALAISAAAQREAEARAEACFARAYARTGDWRTIR
ncbi:MAG: SpoIID/LytB domain-containing protein [Acidobacteria bacterium]|nr:SpoIID/LytB domain-containing protein [Acidobacteriota bacterium]